MGSATFVHEGILGIAVESLLDDSGAVTTHLISFAGLGPETRASPFGVDICSNVGE